MDKKIIYAYQGLIFLSAKKLNLVCFFNKKPHQFKVLWGFKNKNFFSIKKGILLLWLLSYQLP